MRVMRFRYNNGFSCRGRPKEVVMYLADYWGLIEGLIKDLSFQEYCTLDMYKLFIDPYCGKNMKRIAQMFDELCKEVRTRWMPPRAKRGSKREYSSKPSTCPRSRIMFG